MEPLKIVEEQNIRYVKTADLVPYDRNPRIISDEAVDQLAADIRRVGFRDPIEILPDMTILCGHTRRLAAMKLGMETVPVIIHDMDRDEADMYRLTNNKASEGTGWDFPMLKEELARLEDVFDIGELGFELDDPFEDTVPEAADDLEDVGGIDTAVPDTGSGDFAVIVQCSSREARDAAYSRLTDEGYICRKI